MDISRLGEFEERPYGLSSTIVEQQMDIVYTLYLVALHEGTESSVTNLRAGIIMMAVNYLDQSKWTNNQDGFNAKLDEFYERVIDICAAKFIRGMKVVDLTRLIFPDDPSSN